MIRRIEMSTVGKLKTTLALLLALTTGSVAGVWVSAPPLSVPRAGAASVVWQNKIYVFGGKSINNRILKTVEVYDPATGQWDTTSVEPMEEGRYNLAAVVYQNKIYIIGGRDDDDVSDDVYVYDPVQNSWDDAQDLHKEREGHSATIVNGHIYVFGGQNEDHYIINKVEWYDNTKDKWIEDMSAMAQPRVAAMALSINDMLYMFGGYYFGLTNTFMKAKHKNKGLEWSSGPNLPEPRAYGVAIQKQDSIFLVGGETGYGITPSVEIYDLKAGVYFPGPSLKTARSGLTGVCLHDTLYAIGGFGENNEPLNTVEIYVPDYTAIEPFQKLIPQNQILIKGYPNPFNGQIALEISIPRVDFYEITLYNALGMKIKTIYNGTLGNGLHRFYWHGKNEAGNDISSGIYFLRVQAARSTKAVTYKVIYAK